MLASGAGLYRGRCQAQYGLTIIVLNIIFASLA